VRIDRRFLFVVAVSLVWALLVTTYFSRGTRPGKQTQAAGPVKSLVVASRTLPLGTVVSGDAVKLREAPENLFPTGGFSKVEDVVGRPVTATIQADEAVLEARLAPRGSGAGLAPLIPPGMRAISVRVNDVVGVAGFVLPGLRVDVLVTGQPAGRAETQTRTVLQNVPVLSAGQTIQTDGKSAISAPVVTLLVTPEDAEALTLANTEGRIQLVLRNSSDGVVAQPRGRQLSDLYGAPASRAAAAASAAARPPAPRRARVVPMPPPAPQENAVPAINEGVTVIRGAAKTVERAVAR
jgi:pilus assembly protein CpaB